VSGAQLSLALSVFLACSVEAVEAFTIVLAVGTTRRWRAALAGVGAATLVLAILVAALGPALTSLPIGVLRVVVGGLLLTFGLQWLRKAILRASGYVARHDETAAYAREREEAQRAGAERRGGLDWYAFTVAFKGVFLEGTEVVLIVISLGAAQHRLGLAARPGPEHQLEVVPLDADGQEPQAVGRRVLDPLLQAEHVGVEVQRPVLVGDEHACVEDVLEHAPLTAGSARL